MKKDLRFQWCILYLLAIFVTGCTVKRPNEVLPESTMEDLLYDYHIAKAMGDNLPYNENYKKVLYTDAVFNKYGTTKVVFDSSMVWYTRNTEVLAKVYEKVSKRLKAQQNVINHLIAIRDKKPMTSAPGDSVDVWAWQRMKRLTGMTTDDKLTFVLPSDSNFKERDTLVWKVRYQFLGNVPDTALTALMAMQIIFENDSIISATQRVGNSGTQSICLQSDTLGTIREVKGFIYYPREKTPHTLVLDKITLMRYHSNDTLQTLNDSLQSDSVPKPDAVRKEKVHEESTDAVKTDLQQSQRLSPEEMNRRRSNRQREIKPELQEIKPEQPDVKPELREIKSRSRRDVQPEQPNTGRKNVQSEQLELKQDRQMNQRRLQKQVQ